jgi:hypothetical protein
VLTSTAQKHGRAERQADRDGRRYMVKKPPFSS